MTNNVCFKDLKYCSKRLKTVVFILLSVVYTAISAQTSERLQVNEPEVETAKEPGSDVEKTVQEEEYNIHKKHNPISTSPFL